MHSNGLRKRQGVLDQQYLTNKDGECGDSDKGGTGGDCDIDKGYRNIGGECDIGKWYERQRWRV